MQIHARTHRQVRTHTRTHRNIHTHTQRINRRIKTQERKRDEKGSWGRRRRRRKVCCFFGVLSCLNTQLAPTVYEFYRHSDELIIFRHGFNLKIIHLHKIHISTATISMNKHSQMTHAGSLASTHKHTHIYI